MPSDIYVIITSPSLKFWCIYIHIISSCIPWMFILTLVGRFNIQRISPMKPHNLPNQNSTLSWGRFATIANNWRDKGRTDVTCCQQRSGRLPNRNSASVEPYTTTFNVISTQQYCCIWKDWFFRYRETEELHRQWKQESNRRRQIRISKKRMV